MPNSKTVIQAIEGVHKATGEPVLSLLLTTPDGVQRRVILTIGGTVDLGNAIASVLSDHTEWTRRQQDKHSN